MYTEHIEKAPKKMRGIAANFNPMAACASMGSNLPKKHPKKLGVKIWGSRVVGSGGHLMGNTYIFAQHGLIGSDLLKAKLAEDLKKGDQELKDLKKK